MDALWHSGDKYCRCSWLLHLQSLKLPYLKCLPHAPVGEACWVILQKGRKPGHSPISSPCTCLPWGQLWEHSQSALLKKPLAAQIPCCTMLAPAKAALATGAGCLQGTTDVSDVFPPRPPRGICSIRSCLVMHTRS